MATSSITANFLCNDAKAANAFVDLLLAGTPPDKWTAPVPHGPAHAFGSKAEIRKFVNRLVRKRNRKVEA